MITLVACGHTIGSVHSVDHPEIVSGPVEASNIAQFDTTASRFDNAPVVEYLNGSTRNPLIINANDTLNSDKRIFGADGNVTVTKLKDAAVFQAQCEDVFERMLDLVPAGVSLTDPLEPVEVKPQVDALELNRNGTVDFAGKLRIRTTTGATGAHDAADIGAVTLSYLDNSGARQSQEIQTAAARYQGGSSFGYLGETFQWYEWSTTLPSTGISSFDVKVTSVAGGPNATTTYDNAGTGGYPVNANVFFQERNSCLKTAQVGGVWKGNMTLVAAVHKSVQAADAGVQVNLAHRRVQPRNFIPKIEVASYEMEKTGSTSGDYTYYTTTIQNLDVGDWRTTFDIQAGNSTLEYQSAVLLGDKTCEVI